MKQAISKLRPTTRRWVQDLQRTFVLEGYHVRLLVGAGRLWDRAAECREILERDGPLIQDRFCQLKAHPCIEIERQSLIGFSRLLREAGLDLRPDDPRPAQRPGGY